MRLPNEYQEVEYIESSGTQYIILGNSFKTSYKAVIDFQMTVIGGDYIPLGIKYRTTRYGIDVYNSKFMVNGGEETWVNTISEDTNRHTITIDKGTAIVDGNNYSVSYTNYTFSQGIGVFCYNEYDKSPQYNYKSSNKLYKLDIYDENGSHIYDIVPCYRKSDNEIGLYDLVNNQFYINQGTGTFTKGSDIGPTGKIQRIYLGTDLIRPKEKYDVYYSDKNREEYQSLVNSVGSVQFVDTGRRFRFKNGVYIGDRTALDFDGTTMRTIDLDTLTVTSSKSSTISGKVRYFGDNRILTRMGIADFEGNMITTFSTTYNSITPGLPGVVWTNSGYDIYKGVVDGNNVTFTKVGTGLTDQSVGWMFYGRLGAYLINYHDNSGSGNSSYVDPDTLQITNFGAGSSSNGRIGISVSGPDGKLYRKCRRSIGWGLMQKIGTGNEGIVGNSLSKSWLDYGNRWGKFLGNIVSGGMNTNNGTGNGYGSNNYFIATDGTLTKVQDNAFAYDTNIESQNGFIDENGRLYPVTYGGGSGVILKTDKTFTNLSWWNPYLWR